MHRFAVLILLFIVVFCGAANAAVTTTWPQSFSLYAGREVRFTFEVPKAGEITVDATWQGCGLYISLADASGKVVNAPVTSKTSPVKVVYNATAADVQKGKIWTLTISTPPAAAPSQKPVAQGNVRVKVPVSIITQAPIVSKPPAVPNIAKLPAIQSVTPATGSPNDTVVIKGTDIPEDKTKAEVWFMLKANTPAQGTILTASKSGSVITYNVRVPGNDYVYSPYSGPLYVNVKGVGKTNNLTFAFVPCKSPTITSHLPQYGMPGVRTTFKGANFRPTDRVRFVTSQGDVPSPDTDYVSSTQISAIVPPNLPLDLKTIKVYVSYDCKGHWLIGPHYTYPLDPSAVGPKPK